MKRLLISAGLVLTGLAFLCNWSAPVAASVNFNANDVIADAVFDNTNSFGSAAAIDAWLNNFSSSCISTNNGFLSPDPTGYTPSTGFTFGGNVSAGQVIWDASQAYSINPQVLLTTLQKEQSLVTGSAGCHPNTPNPSNTFSCNLYGNGTIPNCTQACPFNGGCINIAVGYGCPSNCNAAQEGFSAQVIRAAWKLKFNEQRSEGNVGWNVQKPGWDNSDDPETCYFGPMTQGNHQQCSSGSNTFYDGLTTIDNSGHCAGLPNTVSVHMDNGATAALYYYTPHICGNYSFYNIFTGWFGPTTSLANILSMNILSEPAATVAKGQQITYTIAITNNLSSPVTVDALGIVGRAGSTTGANRDLGWEGPVTFAPGVAQQYTFTSTVQDSGPLIIWPAIFFSGQYTQFTGISDTTTAHSPNLTLTSPVTFSPANPVAGQSVTVSATIKNNEAVPIQIGTIGIPIRYYGVYAYDVGWNTATPSLAAGSSLTVSGNIVFDKPGPYSAWLSWYFGGQYNNLSPTVSTTTLPANPNFSLTYNITPDATPAVGEAVTIQVNLTNNLPVPMTLGAVGVVGRYGSPSASGNSDFGWVGPESFTPGQTKTYTFTTTVKQLGNFYAWVAINHQGSYVQYTANGFTMYPHMPNVTVSTALQINSGSPVSRGQTVPVTVSIKNNESHPINFDAAGIPVRFYNRWNYDATWVGPGILAASGQSGDTLNLSGNVDFDKPGPFTAWSSLLIGGSYLTIGTPVNITVQ